LVIKSRKKAELNERKKRISYLPKIENLNTAFVTLNEFIHQELPA
jgi:hypothetical protein